MSKNYLDGDLYNKSSVGTTIASSEDELEVELKYTWFAWFMLTWFGTTQNPYYMAFICKKTGEKFEEFTQKKDIEYYMLYRVV